MATVWKNGVATRLGDGKNNSLANGVFLSGNDVIVAGNVTTGDNTVGVLWKNGAAGTINSCRMANSLFVENTNIYVAGQDAALLPAVWKNGLPTTLTTGVPETGTNTTTGAYLKSLSMNDKSVLYVAGYRSTFFNGDNLGVHTISVPLLWQDGVPGVLNNGDSDATLKVYQKTGGRAQAIFIVN